MRYKEIDEYSDFSVTMYCTGLKQPGMFHYIKLSRIKHENDSN